MKELFEINKRLRQELRGEVVKDGICLERGDTSELAGLPSNWQAELAALHKELEEVIPKDFSFGVILGQDEPRLTVDYEDGPQVGTFGMAPKLAENLSVFEQLKAMDWDEYRGLMMEQCQTYEKMVEETKDSPADLPSTRELQKAFRKNIETFAKRNRVPGAKVQVLVYSEMEAQLHVTDYGSLEEFAAQLYNLLAVRQFVVAIFVDKKPLPIVQIDALKEKTLKELASMPMSHAVALGKL